MISIERQIKAVDKQISALKVIAERDKAGWANKAADELLAAKRTLSMLKSIGKGID